MPRLRLPIESERLLLRAFAPDDAAAMLAVYGDEEVMRYIPGGALPDERAVRAELGRHARELAERGFAFLAVVERESGRVVGDAGFGVFDPTGDLELGYTLARETWGRGYATEAGRACLQAAFRDLDPGRVVAVVDVRNEPSARVCEKLGMTLERRLEAHGLPHLLYVARRSAQPSSGRRSMLAR